MACDAATLEALIATDKLPELSDRDRLMCLAAVYGQAAGQNAQQALDSAYQNGLSKLSDRDLEQAFLAAIC